MEHPVTFDLRYAAHRRQVARANAEEWRYQAAPTARLTTGTLRAVARYARYALTALGTIAFGVHLN